VKRAEAKIVRPSFLQSYKTAYNFGNVDTTQNLLYGLL
jgi:hypothetical protein